MMKRQTALHTQINLLKCDFPEILLHLSRFAFAQDWHFYIHLIAIEIGFVCFHLIKAAQTIQLYQYVQLYINILKHILNTGL